MLEIKKEDIKDYKVNKKSRKKRPSKPKKFLKELAQQVYVEKCLQVSKYKILMVYQVCSCH